MEKTPVSNEKPVLTAAEELVLEFANRVPFALTRDAQADLVQEFTIKSHERGVDIDWRFYLPPQVIDQI